MNSGEKSCPDCAETIKSAAMVCRFCGFRMNNMRGSLPQYVQQQEQQPSPVLEERANDQFHCPYCNKVANEERGICGHCQHWFAEGHPKQGQQATWNELTFEKPAAAIIGGIVVIIGVLGMIFWNDAPDIAYRSPSPSEAVGGAESGSTGADETEIVTMCDLSVKSALISEADLDFGWKFVPRSANEYRVVRGFKAQNGFGANLKHTYFCTYDTSTKRVTKLEVEGPGGSQKII